MTAEGNAPPDNRPLVCACPCRHEPPCHYCAMGAHQTKDWMERY